MTTETSSDHANEGIPKMTTEKKKLLISKYEALAKRCGDDAYDAKASHKKIHTIIDHNRTRGKFFGIIATMSNIALVVFPTQHHHVGRGTLGLITLVAGFTSFSCAWGHDHLEHNARSICSYVAKYNALKHGVRLHYSNITPFATDYDSEVNKLIEFSEIYTGLKRDAPETDIRYYE